MTLSEEVAVALGRVPCPAWRLWGVGIGGNEWIKDTPCGHKDCYPPDEPPDYEHNWILTGPLIERFGLSIAPLGDSYRATVGGKNGYGIVAPSLLHAICKLVVLVCAEYPLVVTGKPLTPPTGQA